MIHPAHAGDGIANARGDAGAEQGRDHRVRIVADLIFALDDVNSPLRARRDRHANLPTTASMAPRNEVTVKGFVT